MEEDPDGNKLGDMAFLHERPWVRCVEGSVAEEDPLKWALYVATFLNMVVIPGYLMLAGWYIERRTGTLLSCRTCIEPKRQLKASAQGVTVAFDIATLDPEKLEGVPGDQAAASHVPGLAASAYAAAYTACASELLASSEVKAGALLGSACCWISCNSWHCMKALSN